MIVLEGIDPKLFARVQEQNLIRQYDLLRDCIDIGIQKGPVSFDKYTLWAFNHVAVVNIAQFGGRFRDEPIYVGDHKPPHFKEVPDLMDKYFAFIHENWDVTHPTVLAGYALWRLNWIHPFVEGNGRTARAACYYILCVKAGSLLPGSKIVPERIRENREPYYAALRSADRAWHEGNLEVSEISEYLAGLLEAQLKDED